MSEHGDVHLPGWVAGILAAWEIGADEAGGALAGVMERLLSPLLRTAADAFAKELERSATLRSQRRDLEREQRDLQVRVGLPAESETCTEPDQFLTVAWPERAVPAREDLLVAAVLLLVQHLDDLHAAMELGSRSSSVHYDNYELAHDNQVIGFHNAALRSRAEAAHGG